MWATALGAGDGLTEAVPTAVFLVALALSMVTLAHVVKHIPISVAYAIWSGAGAALTVTWALATGSETVGVLKLLFLAGIVACTAGLKLLKPPAAESEA